VADGRAEIGVQLHPWVNPPHAEDLTVSNSFAGNLEPALEEAKLVKLRDTISRAFNGTAPLIYRAGRYGVGPHTAAILGQASIAIDTSVRAHFDYSSQGGPDFTGLPAHPWWVDRRGGLMELPLTTVFSGLLRRAGPWLFPRLWRVPRLRGVLARLGLMNRVPLTPEGVSAAEAIAGIDLALGDGLPVLVFSFHSPSLRPGNTPYVRDDDQLDQLYGWWRTVFAHLARRGVRPAGVAQIMQAAQIRARPKSRAAEVWRGILGHHKKAASPAMLEASWRTADAGGAKDPPNRPFGSGSGPAPKTIPTNCLRARLPSTPPSTNGLSRRGP
jgi:hypothetical protein